MSPVPEVLVWLITGLWIAHRLAWQPLGHVRARVMVICVCASFIACDWPASFYSRLVSTLYGCIKTHTGSLSQTLPNKHALFKLPQRADKCSHFSKGTTTRAKQTLFISRANESSVNSPLGYVVELMFKQREVWLQMHAASMPTPRTKTHSTAHSASPHITYC